jgi:starvation-inducible outer membrane lipoprotein
MLTKLAKQTIFILLIVTVLSNCTSTTTQRKDPVFKVDIASLTKELRNVVVCEHINLDGRIVTTDKKSNSELEIGITNGDNIPAGDDEIKDLGKTVALLVKNDLKDPNEYDTYSVLFITQTEVGGITKRNWRGHVFRNNEL